MKPKNDTPAVEVPYARERQPPNKGFLRNLSWVGFPGEERLRAVVEVPAAAADARRARSASAHAARHALAPAGTDAAWVGRDGGGWA
jgi:hypothetical protein